jgi:hypothetical protein
MADRQTKKVEVTTEEEASELFGRFTRWIEKVEPLEGGTVQKHPWPDLWAYFAGLALIAEAISIGMVLAHWNADFALWEALLGLVLAIASIAYHQKRP